MTLVSGNKLRLPDVWEETVPALQPKPDGVSSIVDVVAGCILPHEWIYCLSRHHPDEYEMIFGISKARGFWDSLDMSDPRVVEHPMLTETVWETMFVPYYFHGDGAA